jgi:hypothetical protein
MFNCGAALRVRAMWSAVAPCLRTLFGRLGESWTAMVL